MRKFCGSAQDRKAYDLLFTEPPLSIIIRSTLHFFNKMSVTVYLFRLHEREISHCGIPSTVDE